ncbi:hypothetical protein V6N13_064910 [Hibiscus sabdariffa]
MLQGLHFAFDLGLQSVIVESDSKSVVQKLKSLALDYSDIKIFSRHFASCDFSFKSRICNKAAHALAAEGGSLCRCLGISPVFLLHLVSVMFILCDGGSSVGWLLLCLVKLLCSMAVFFLF